jgi:diphthine synthase
MYLIRASNGDRATTHTDLVIRARELGIPVQVIHNASIMNAIGACGLQLYNFGQTISIVFFTETWRPDSFYDRIKENRALGLHTLCLLGGLRTERKQPDLLVVNNPLCRYQGEGTEHRELGSWPKDL